MGDRFLPDVPHVGAAAPTIAAITDKSRLNSLWRQKAGDNGEVATNNSVRVELLAEAALRRHGAREDDETARILVEPMDDPQSRPALAPSLLAGDQRR